MTDGTPCAVKAACTVWSRGKNRKRSFRPVQVLPMAIVRAVLLPGLPGPGQAGRRSGTLQRGNHAHLFDLHRFRTR